MAKDWSIYRNEIEALYSTQNKSLLEVRRILKGRHHFDASIRAYRMRLELWGVKKNRTSSRNSHQSPSLGGFLSTQMMNISSTEGPSAGYAFHRSLFDIIESGADEELNVVLSSGSSVHIQDHLNNSPLHAAVLNDNMGMVKALLRYGANVDSIGHNGNTALHLANTSMEMLLLLLRHQPNLSLQDDDGNTILHHMLLIPNWWDNLVVRTTIQSVLSSGANINILNQASESPLHLILIARLVRKSVEYMEVVSGFLNSTPDVKTRMRNGQTPFVVFIENTRILRQHGFPGEMWVEIGFRCLEQFLAAGADPNINLHPHKLIHYCLKQGQFCKGKASENFLLLLIQRADLDLVSNGDYPLHMVLGRVNSTAWGPHDRNFPLCNAVSNLIARKVDVNQSNGYGATPLEIWLQKVSVCRSLKLLMQVALLLCEAGASIMVTTTSHKTLFDLYSCRSRSSGMTMTKNLLLADIRFQEKNNDSNTNPPSEWAQTWRSAWKQSRWYFAKADLEKLEATAFRPRTTQFMTIASVVVAERLLEMHRAELRLWLNGDVEKDSIKDNYKEYGAILKDVCVRKMMIDQSFWEFMVDIMDFNF